MTTGRELDAAPEGRFSQLTRRTVTQAWTVRGSDDVVLIENLATPGRIADVVALNNGSVVETSHLEAADLRTLLDLACCAAGIEDGGRIRAFLIALDQDAAYDNPNFAWFKARYPTFVYVDRVVTAAQARGRGHGRRLYAHLFEAARRAGQAWIVCEVNRSPPNPGSDAFHHALGFREVGQAALASGKVVRYLEAGIGALSDATRARHS